MLFVDINLDNREDLVLTHAYLNGYGATVFEQQGQEFLPISKQNVGFIGTHIGLGDFDANLFPDIGISDGANQSVFFNQGNTTFVSVGGQPVTGIPATPFPNDDASAVAVDMPLNNDNRVDHVEATDDHTVQIYIRDISNQLVSVKTSSFDVQSSCSTQNRKATVLPAADFDGDGLFDPAGVFTFTCVEPSFLRLGEVRVFLNKGGSFQEIRFSFSDQTYNFIRYQDLDHNSTPDLIFWSEANHGYPSAYTGINVLFVNKIAASTDLNSNLVPDDFLLLNTEDKKFERHGNDLHGQSPQVFRFEKTGLIQHFHERHLQGLEFLQGMSAPRRRGNIMIADQQ